MRALAAVLAGVLATTASGQTVYGIVESVDSEGRILIENGGDALELWGLRITDSDMLENLIIGRSVRCATVTEANAVRLVDCNIEPDRAFVFDLDFLNLYAWLPAIGAAAYDCPEHHRPPDVAGVANQKPISLPGSFKIGPVGYGCPRGPFPRRGTIYSNPIPVLPSVAD